MRTKTSVIAIAVALTMSACGGGGSGSSNAGSNGNGGSSGSTGSTGTTKTTPGVWQGSVTSTSGTSSAIGFTIDSGHSVWMTTDGRVWTGQMPATGTQMNVVMTGYMYPGRQFPDGSNYGMWSMMASYAGGTWNGHFSGSGDDVHFDFSMSPAYDRPASLDLLAGTYTRTTSIGYTITLSFSPSGELTGSDSRGCVFNGTVSVPDPTHNLYQLAVAVSSCGILDGNYQGHGTLVDATAM